ncbi:MAG: reverse transcriptase domain-containing protein [Candidatus Nanoarchaeia archaeon]|nr:reverse transcriptase domain-containing protein [Candidatus Nanoarchaeia archaeon]MDD5587753.1 reverse transcriptase domain-containing protein [Candidatus Nanoarchaeia archaeon]
MVHTYNNLYSKLYLYDNLFLAYKKARKGKTKKDYVIEFEKNLETNLLKLQKELETLTYKPKPLKKFILRDPKTRKISKADFRDRIVHHVLINMIEPIFDKTFIYDSCANRKGKGNLFAIKRFYYFLNKVSRNGKLNGWFNENQIKSYCLKADIKHYFQEVNYNLLINIIKRKISDKKVINLIRLILENGKERKNIGMPLGNLTSQFFANVYLNELDYYIKHKLRVKYYIRYVDDFVILHPSKEQLKIWKEQINNFLNKELKLELHSEKSKIISLSKGIDFVGFRNFYYHKLLRKRNIRKILFRISQYKNNEIIYDNLLESFNGWNAYAKWADSYKLRSGIISFISDKYLPEKIKNKDFID